jgi:hypothetical protein
MTIEMTDAQITITAGIRELNHWESHNLHLYALPEPHGPRILTVYVAAAPLHAADVLLSTSYAFLDSDPGALDHISLTFSRTLA